MKRKFLLCLTALVFLGPISLQAGPPKSFQKNQPAQWQVYELRADVLYDHAWETMLDLLISDFDLNTAMKENGYIRTDWLYAYGGKYNAEYRLRVTVRFSPDRHTLRVKADAEQKNGEDWIIGVDSRLLSTLKSDIMGTIGRTTK